MADRIRIGVVAANAACNATVDLLDNGYLRIYDGAQPSGPDIPIGSQRLLAESRFGHPAFHAAVDGVARSFPIDPSKALDTGEASWYRMTTSKGAGVVDGSVGERDANMILSSLLFEKGGKVIVEEMQHRQAVS